jgi:hypothetical protein
MNMRTRMFPLAVLASCLAVHASDIEITSLAGNGRLTWTNSFTNGLFSIEWAAALGTNSWRSNWIALQNFWVGGFTNTVEVPMFYRVKCVTNLFMPMPFGSQFVYTWSNAVTGVSTRRMNIAGVMSIPVLGKEFRLVGDPASSGVALKPLRSTESEVWAIATSGEEELMWFNGPVGATRTNYLYRFPEAGRVQTLTVETNEVVQVPAGTFNCVRMRKRDSWTDEPEIVWWIAPGFFVVKWTEIWVGKDPDYFDLQSYSLTGQ